MFNIFLYVFYENYKKKIAFKKQKSNYLFLYDKKILYIAIFVRSVVPIFKHKHNELIQQSYKVANRINNVGKYQ